MHTAPVTYPLHVRYALVNHVPKPPHHLKPRGVGKVDARVYHEPGQRCNAHCGEAVVRTGDKALQKVHDAVEQRLMRCV